MLLSVISVQLDTESMGVGGIAHEEHVKDKMVRNENLWKDGYL